MNPVLLASLLNGTKNILSNRKVQIALLLIIVYFIFKKKIRKTILKWRQRQFDKNDGDLINQLALKYRSAVNPSSFNWMINFDGTTDSQIEILAHQTRGKLQLVSDAYKLKFNESLVDRMRKELSAKKFQNWSNIVN